MIVTRIPRLRQCGVIALALAALPVLASVVLAAEPEKALSPLSSKQEMIRERFKRFEDRIFRVREKLQLAEPDNAARLERALKRAGELGLGDQLEHIVALLNDPALLNAATDAQAEWLEQADAVLAILLEREANNEDRKNEIERLEGYRQRLRELLEQQHGLRDASAQASNRLRMQKQLDQALQRIEDLLKKQEEAQRETSRKDELSEKDRAETAEKQKQLSRSTSELGEELRQLGESAPSESSDSPDQKESREGAKEASEALKSGAESMKGASEAAEEGEKEELKDRQERAEEELRRARDRLKKAREELAPSRETKEQSGKQRETADKTQGLSDQMRKDGEQKQQKGQQGGQSGKPTPGQQSLDQAEDEMRDAAEKLDEDKPEDATKEQDKAVEQLEQAQKELEDELNQLRKEDREETLRNLEARFREMLAKQREINAQTVTLDQFGKDRFRRAEQLQLADMSEKQKKLAEQASSALHVLDEEGTTIVFPRIVEQLAEDMNEVAGRLSASEVGALTQSIEQQIVETLEELVGAVQKMQEQNQQQQNQPGGPPSDNQPLLPASAELKLLKASQLRVNNRTKVIEETRQAGSEVLESLAKSLRAAAERQRECARIAEEMRDKENVQ